MIISVFAACSQAKESAEHVAGLVVRNYDVHDLFLGNPDGYDDGDGAAKTHNRRLGELVDLIKSSVAPGLWKNANSPDGHAGAGSITSRGDTLVIAQSPDVHDQVASLFAILRADRLQEVSIETRFLFVDDKFISNLLSDKSATAQSGIATGDGSIAKLLKAQAGDNPVLGTLDGLATSFLIRSAQVSRETTSLSAPRVNMVSGQTARAGVTKNVLDTSFTQFSSTYAYPPDVWKELATEPASGFTIEAQGIVAPDQTHILVHFTFRFFGIAKDPVTATATSVLPTGSTLVLRQMKVSVPGQNSPALTDDRTLLILVRPTALTRHLLTANQFSNSTEARKTAIQASTVR
jgi:hypothetical protein